MKANMRKIFQILKIYPLSSMIIATIWILCFMDVPETPLSDVSFIDKWTHLAMYGTLCAVLCVETVRHYRRAASRVRIALTAWLLPVVMSGIIEILQATCTGGRRSGEWMDFAANSVGATIGVVIGILLAVYAARGRRDC